MPAIFYVVGAIIPTTYFIALMRAIILRGATFFEYWPSLAIMSGMADPALLRLRPALPQEDRLTACVESRLRLIVKRSPAL